MTLDNNGRRVLEVGCGALVPIVQFSNCARYGIDPLVHFTSKQDGRSNDYDAKIINGFAENRSYLDAYFDAVISVNALDHVDDFQEITNEIQEGRETERRAVLRGGISRADGHRASDVE
jgi:ubiquinone/menaquinone biosynthesis C-methylase UbiE